MDTKEIIDRFYNIIRLSGNGDNEAAHQAEDALYLDILRAIADGDENPKFLATMAIATQNINFDRWYA